MDASSPVYAALGAIGFDALDDLSRWLDVSGEPARAADSDAWASRSADSTAPLSGWEG